MEATKQLDLLVITHNDMNSADDVLDLTIVL